MSRHYYLITIALAFSAACGSDKPKPGAGGDASAEPAAEAAKVVNLPPLTPLGKPAAELQAEGWTTVEIPPEVAARLRDTTSAASPQLFSAVTERELRALAQPANTPSFDSLGGFADTVRLVERALIRMAAERRDTREAERVDSLERAMEPRDPDLDAVPAESELRRPALLVPDGADIPIHLAVWRGTLAYPAGAEFMVPSQGGQTKTFQLAPGIEGTETSSSDGSSVTTEVALKGGNARGNAEVSMKGTATIPDEFEKQGEVGSTQDISTTMKGKIDGSVGEFTKGFGWEERLAYCPDAAGLVRGRFKISNRQSMNVTMKGVTGSYDIALDGDFALTVQVNDEARATELLVAGHATVKMEGGQRGGGNATPVLINGRGEGRAQGVSLDADAANPIGSMHLRLPPAGPGVNLKYIRRGITETLAKAIGFSRELAKKAEQRWRNGACVEVIATPRSKGLRYSGKTNFQIEVKHKRGGSGSFTYPVRAMAQKWGALPGQVNRTVGTLTPQGIVSAPITYQYIAPAKGTQAAQVWRTMSPPRDDMFLVSVSRRGIGVDAFAVPFDSLRRTFHVTYHHFQDTQKRGMAQEVTYRAVLHELDQPDDNGNTFAGAGNYSLVSRLWKANCDNDLPDDFEVVRGGGAVRAKGSIPSEDSETVSLIFTLEPLAGPRIRFFTKSFVGLEKGVRREVTRDSENDVPFMAYPAIGLINVRGKSGDTTKVVITGETKCEGEMTTKTVARVKRLR